MGALDLLVTWILPVLASLPLLFLIREGWPARWPSGLWRRGWLPVFLLTRPVYALLLFVALDYWTASDAWAWQVHTEKLLDGLVPGRDFENLYGHLYYYLLGAGRLATAGHWVGTLLPMMVGDLVTVVLGARLGRRMLGDAGGRWIGAWLLVTPFLWHQLVVRGQEESLFVAFLVLAVWLLGRDRATPAAIVLGLGVCTNKLTFGPFALAVMVSLSVGRRRALRPWVAAGAVVIAVYAVFTALGAPILPTGNLAEHTRNWGLGLSVPDTIARLWPGFPPMIALVLYAAASFAAAVGAPILLRELAPVPRAIAAIAAVHCVSMLTMPFCVSPYLAQGAPFLLLVLATWGIPARLRTAGLAGLAVLGAFCALHWTQSRVFSIPLKPLSIAFSACFLWLLLRYRREPVREGGV